MFKFILFLSIFSVHFFANAGVKIEVQYSYSADLFDLMDNVSNWWEGFTEPEYQVEWQKRIGLLTEDDKKYFLRYQEVRQHYYNDPDQKEKDPLKNRNGFFSRLGAITADPFAEAFYDSLTLDESFNKLSKLVKTEELNFLKEFYGHFENKAKVLLDESAAFKRIIPHLKKSLSGHNVEKYFSDVASFYGVSPKLTYRVLFVWFPHQ